MLDIQGFVWINQLITELLTASLAKNATDKRKNMYAKINNVAECKRCKEILLAVEYQILIISNYPTAKTGMLCNSTNGVAGQPADNLPHSNGLRVTVKQCTN
jgi:hypothetical protein